jgi:hypothetical protein
LVQKIAAVGGYVALDGARLVVSPIFISSTLDYVYDGAYVYEFTDNTGSGIPSWSLVQKITDRVTERNRVTLNGNHMGIAELNPLQTIHMYMYGLSSLITTTATSTTTTGATKVTMCTTVTTPPSPADILAIQEKLAGLRHCLSGSCYGKRVKVLSHKDKAALFDEFKCKECKIENLPTGCGS